MNIEKLVQIYKDEDKDWSIPILLKWLVEKKGVHREIADLALRQALNDLDNGLGMKSHRGKDGFDNYVLNIARSYEEDIYIETYKSIEKKFKKSTDGKLKKIWKVIKGEL